MRRECKKITVRGVGIGGGERVTVQSMTNSDTADRAATLPPAASAGFFIVRALSAHTAKIAAKRV